MSEETDSVGGFWFMHGMRGSPAAEPNLIRSNLTRRNRPSTSPNIPKSPNEGFSEAIAKKIASLALLTCY